MKHITFFITLFLVAGCSRVSSTETEPISTSSSTPPVTTLLPIKSTQTIEFATQSPLPPEEAETMMLDLLQYHPDCLLPCWFGLTPGKTSVQTARSLLEEFAAISLITTYYDDVSGTHWRIDENGLLLDTIVSFTHDRQLTSILENLRVTIEVKEQMGGGFETIWENPLNNQYLQAYRLPQILSIYGQPEQVLVFANEGWNYFELMLDYSNRGFAVWYSMPLESSGEKFSGCPSRAFTKLYLWVPEFAYTWAEGVTGNGDQYEIDSLNRDFQSIEGVTSLKLEEFYDVFGKSMNTKCLETQKEYWPGP